jgi:hypothetical protein
VVETVITDSLGRCTFEQLAQSTDYRVCVTTPGYYPDSSAFSVPAFDGTPLSPLSATIRLSTSRGSIIGTVRNAFTSQPMDSATVYLSVLTFKKTGTIWVPKDSIISSTQSDTMGKYNFTGIEADYGYSVHAASSLYKTSERVDLTITPAESTLTDIALWIASGLNATVRDSTAGTPVKGASIILSGTKYAMKNDVLTKVSYLIDSATTDSAGKVSLPLELNNVINRNYTVTARATGYSEKNDIFSIDTTDSVAGLYFDLFPGSSQTIIAAHQKASTTSMHVLAGNLIITAAEPLTLLCHDISGRIIFSKNFSKGIHNITADKNLNTMVIMTIKSKSQNMLIKKYYSLR